MDANEWRRVIALRRHANPDEIDRLRTELDAARARVTELEAVNTQLRAAIEAYLNVPAGDDAAETRAWNGMVAALDAAAAAETTSGRPGR